MTKDDFRDALAVSGAGLADDVGGQRIIRAHARPEGLADGPLRAMIVGLRILAGQAQIRHTLQGMSRPPAPIRPSVADLVVGR